MRSFGRSLGRWGFPMRPAVLALSAFLAFEFCAQTLLAQNSRSLTTTSAQKNNPEPVVRIALMTDVSSVRLDCPAGLSIERTGTAGNERIRSFP